MTEVQEKFLSYPDSWESRVCWMPMQGRIEVQEKLLSYPLLYCLAYLARAPLSDPSLLKAWMALSQLQVLPSAKFGHLDLLVSLASSGE
eukprot:CAMPEP_0169410580 /NCGR_PEP_ID=MMETSP1017-20121227/59851_1 /TAXON_ID=342587 /ORGANISM="Karlodinium micrum, Strain CCMP2283" /LENGTH=88 /DNA_ID=CAMNT_0009517843 /DNA_START=178 /DNA_END=444 /DNA_ORIENTATION=+